jgi:glutamyl-Q tRNA(Asp) synthetase
LHLGHAYSALLAYHSARRAGGRFLLRIEDIDFNRSKAAFETQIYEDLRWLGIDWDGPVLRQSERKSDYDDTISKLWDENYLFACSCTRKEIAITSAPQEGGEPLIGPDGVIYPGTCRNEERSSIASDLALRLNVHRIESKHFSYSSVDGTTTPFSKADVIDNIGDVVLARKDIGVSYHLAVVLDDAAQGITHVTRGEDLLEATKIHVVLQNILGLPTPVYHHHKLIRDEAGKRLAKRDDARSIKSYRESGLTVDQVLNLMK